jgi:MYXO-CTERM domain-containing protein
MNRTTLRHGLILLTAGIGASLGHISSASADTPVFPAVLKLSAGVGGELDKNQGPGNEMGYPAVFTNNGSQYVVTIAMNSNVKKGDNEKYWQCKCTSVLMDPILGPKVIVSEKQITDNGGSRSCNHPRIASNGEGYGVWTYGSNDVNGNTRTYVQGINHMCETMGDRLRISENNNNNDGAPHIVFNGGDYYTAGYLSTNNDDTSFAVGVMANMTDGVKKTWIKGVVAPSNIGRPSIVPIGMDRSFFCASEGNNRPPETGITCALLNSMTGEIIHKETIAKSDPANNVYMGQPTVAKISDTMMAIQYLESNGQGKKTNIKGSNASHLVVYSISGDTFSKQAYANGIGLAPTHSSICSGSYGEKGENYVAVFGMSPTGGGQPNMQFTYFNGGSLKADIAKDNWIVGYYGDSGRLSNLYGANPNTQGREFPMCVGGVKNPGFGLKNGWMNTVETFFLAPHTGNNGTSEELKNGLYLSFVPGKISAPVDSKQPGDPKKGISTDTGIVDPTSQEPSEPAAPENPDLIDQSSVNLHRASACSVPAPGGSAPANLAFLALGVGALFAARRRR